MKRCTVCNHPRLGEIDQDLKNGLPFRTLAAKYGLSVSALFRHTKNLLRQLDYRRRQEERKNLTELLDKLDLMEHRLNRLFLSAYDRNSFHVAFGCIQETVRLLSLQAKLRRSRDGNP